MKKNNIRRRGTTLAVAGFLATLAVVGALAFGYGELKAIYHEQFVVEDMSAQVDVVSGKMVKADVLTESLGIRKGANLAEIDFREKRREVLRRIPTLREISIVRRQPGSVAIRAVERTPAVRLNVVGRKAPSGRVADADGVAFDCARGTQSLPTIREAHAQLTPAGTPLRGRVRAALDLVLASRESEFADLNILEVDTSKKDFLVATLGDYSRAKICWEDMDESTPASRAALNVRLAGLAKAVRSRCDGLKAVIWDATLPDYVYANTLEKL